LSVPDELILACRINQPSDATIWSEPTFGVI
jgi:hypothetical protein